MSSRNAGRDRFGTLSFFCWRYWSHFNVFLRTVNDSSVSLCVLPPRPSALSRRGAYLCSGANAGETCGALPSERII